MKYKYDGLQKLLVIKNEEDCCCYPFIHLFTLPISLQYTDVSGSRHI